MASVGWIDFSPAHRNRIGSVLDLLRPEGVVDELGLGTMRDALANRLFPGISTIQTRAKYFFIIPYILYDYQSLKPSQRRGRTPTRFLEEKEYEIMWQLAQEYNYIEGNGVIGISKRKPNKIARRPSAIYWNGLSTYNFIDTRGLAASSFLNQAVNPSMESLLSEEPKGDDGGKDDRDAEYESMFRIKVAPKTNWSGSLRLDLDKDEAEFFADRINSLAKNTLLSTALTNERLWQVFNKAGNFADFVKSAIQLPLSDEVRSMLIIAHDFSELAYGIHLAYNCQLQRKVFNRKNFEDDWKDWTKNIQRNMLDYANFNPDVLFTHAITTRAATTQFVNEWWSQTQNGFRDFGVNCRKPLW